MVVVVFIVALAVRGGWGAISMVRARVPQQLQFPDEEDYWSIAQSVADGDGLVGEHGFRALRMPLYPALLSVLAHADHGVSLSRVAQWFVGALSAVFVAVLGAKIGGRTVGIVAGFLVAFDPFLVFFSSLLLTETLYITAQCALLVAGWGLLRGEGQAGMRRWLIVGLCAAVCVYVRESSVVLCVSWIVLLVACRRIEGTALIGGGVAILVIIVALLPWALRNERVTGRLCWLTHRGGISLYDGVGPQATGASDLGHIKQMEAVRGLDEVAWNSYFMQRSLRSITEDPGRVLWLAGVKLARTWNPVPNADTYQSLLIRAVSAAWTIPVYGLGVLGAVYLWRRDRSAVVALLLPAMCVTVLHSVFVGSVRYRLIAMPTLEVLAAVGVCWLLTRRTVSPGRASPSQPGH